MVKIRASDKGDGHGSVNLELHELAHSIDNIVYDGIRKDWDFFRIREKKEMFYVKNQLLRQKAPETYNFIKQLDKKLDCNTLH
ncbi:hypothetical protein MHB45_28125 [Peribacillus sp. FSL K6-5616]|uniref:anthrax toxin lethal factor-related metalloendopeptidase n=1 Tax=Peribacillus frigoritolerans TaxID=450367 RepID=UPI0030F975B0